MTNSNAPDVPERPPSGLPAGQLRIGDAEREAAATALGEHFVAGRLDRNELDARLSAACAARTGADLAVLFADLPGPRPAGLSHRRAPVLARGARPPVVALAVVVALLVLGMVAVGAWVGGRGFPPPLLLIGLLWLWGAGRRHRRA